MHRFALSSCVPPVSASPRAGTSSPRRERQRDVRSRPERSRHARSRNEHAPTAPSHRRHDAAAARRGAPLEGFLFGLLFRGAPACYADMPFTPPPWKPPTPLHEGACTALELQRIAQCAGASNCTSGSATCDACAETDIGAAAYGPIITRLILGQRRFVEVNWGGCQANFDGDASAGGRLATRRTRGNPACSKSARRARPSMRCIEFAAEHGCSGSSETFACASEWSSDSGVPTCAYLQTLLTLWCGP